MAEQLFWRVKEHLGQQLPGFVAGRPRGAAFRFKVPIHVVDTTVMNWWPTVWIGPSTVGARRPLRRICGSICKVCWPNFVIIDTAGEHDNKRARELCAGVKSGEITLFDKGYMDFGTCAFG